MRTALLLLILCAGLNPGTRGQNILVCNGAIARPGDTVTLALEIRNTDRFISFQLDLPLPENVSLVGNSIRLSERSVNHVALGTMDGANLRIFSYSPDNSAFKGNSGEVISMKLAVGSLHGEFVMAPQNGIIGDSLSRNILTGIENGILSVFPAGVAELPAGGPFAGSVSICPNPVGTTTLLRFGLTATATLSISVFNARGQRVLEASPGTFAPGRHEADISTLLQDLTHGSIYYLRLCSAGSPGRPALLTFIKE